MQEHELRLCCFWSYSRLYNHDMFHEAQCVLRVFAAVLDCSTADLEVVLAVDSSFWRHGAYVAHGGRIEDLSVVSDCLEDAAMVCIWRGRGREADDLLGWAEDLRFHAYLFGLEQEWRQETGQQ